MPYFLRELQLITVFLLICGSYMSWSTRFFSLKLCVEFSIFDFVSFLLNLHTVLLPDHWFLSCNKKFENSKISAWVGAPKKLTWCQFFWTYKIEALRTSVFLFNISKYLAFLWLITSLFPFLTYLLL